MTHLRVRWRSVRFGLGVTLLAAMMPFVYILIASPTPDGKTRDIAADPDVVGVSFSGISPIVGVLLALLIVAIASVVIIGVIAVFSRSHRHRA